MGRILVCLMVVAVLVAGCGSDAGRESPEPGEVVGAEIERLPPASTDAGSLVEGLNEFGLDFYRHLAGSAPEENLVFSPLSIAVAFGMADAGARGETAAQIEEVFHFPASGEQLHAAFNALDQALADSGESTLRLANRLYPATGYDLEPAFVETLGASYGAPLERLDFADDPEAARKRINAWVAERTEKLIPELMPSGSLDPNTVLVLVNALYLRAKWSEPFGKYPTEQEPFTRLDGSAVKAPLMQNAELSARYVDSPGYQAVELPYGKGELTMLVVVPRDLATFERDVDGELLGEIDAAAATGIVDLHLPKWSASTDLDLAENLAPLGLDLPFSGGDLTGISPGNPFIDAGVHAATIEVDEQGTVAAAATGLGFATSGPPEPDAVIRADRPFLYLIRDTETGAVLFFGRVVDPTAAA